MARMSFFGTSRPAAPASSPADVLLPARRPAGTAPATIRPAWLDLVLSLADTAAEMIAAPFGGAGAGRRWVVQEAGSDLEISRVARGKVERIARLADGDEAASAAWHRELTAAEAIELRLDPGKLVRQRFPLPFESRGFLEPIIEHRLDRLTPWKADNVLYGFDVRAGAGRNEPIEIEFAATSRDIAKAALERLERFGIRPTAIGSAADPLAEPLAVDLMAGSAPPRRTRRRRVLSRACLAVLPLALLGFGASLVGVAGSQADLDAVSAELEAQRRIIQSRSLAADPRQAALSLIEGKSLDTATFALIDRLAATIPDDTFLTDIEISPTSLRLKGRSGDAPALIPILETRAGLTDVRFESSVIRETNGGDRFDIVAGIEGRGAPAAETP